jgi:hypothetical protein
MRADAAIEIIGVSASATTSTIASEFGVIVEPTMTLRRSVIFHRARRVHQPDPRATGRNFTKIHRAGRFVGYHLHFDGVVAVVVLDVGKPCVRLSDWHSAREH